MLHNQCHNKLVALHDLSKPHRSVVSLPVTLRGRRRVSPGSHVCNVPGSCQSPCAGQRCRRWAEARLHTRSGPHLQQPDTLRNWYPPSCKHGQGPTAQRMCCFCRTLGLGKGRMLCSLTWMWTISSYTCSPQTEVQTNGDCPNSPGEVVFLSLFWAWESTDSLLC